MRKLVIPSYLLNEKKTFRSSRDRSMFNIARRVLRVEKGAKESWLFMLLLGHHYKWNLILYLCWDAEASGRSLLHVLTFENLLTRRKWWSFSGIFKCLCRIHLPLDVNFFVLMIFAANSSPVDFWTHRLTIENAPLEKIYLKLVFDFYLIHRLTINLVWKLLTPVNPSINLNSSFLA